MRMWSKNLDAWRSLWFALAAIASFHLAYSFEHGQILLVVFLYCLFRLANVRSIRAAFYTGLTIGLAIYAPQLRFFWTIFQVAAIPLWLVLSFWMGLFLVLGRACLGRFGIVGWACAAPFLWTGLEYFRSELYYLRFSWLNAGYAFSGTGSLHYLAGYGVYGIGFVFMAVAAFLGIARRLEWRGRIFAGIVVGFLLLYPALTPALPIPADRTLRVTGVQLEFPAPSEAVLGLDRAIANFPATDLFVLSEYTFMGPVPDIIKKWCRKHRKYLVAGGEDPISATAYYNTAFVISPEGEIVFRQAKCVPIQFFKDGFARTQSGAVEFPLGQSWVSPSATMPAIRG